MFSYCTRSHSTLNYTCPWSDLLINHDETFKWSSPHCHARSVVSIHKLRFMFSILWWFYNTFILTLILICNQGWMWSNNPCHCMHLGLSPWLCCFLVKCDKSLQLNLLLLFLSFESFFSMKFGGYFNFSFLFQ